MPKNSMHVDIEAPLPGNQPGQAIAVLCEVTTKQTLPNVEYVREVEMRSGPKVSVDCGAPSVAIEEVPRAAAIDQPESRGKCRCRRPTSANLIHLTMV